MMKTSCILFQIVVHSFNFFFFFLLFFDCVACGILVPYPGIELAPPAVEAWRVNHWTTREVCIQLLKPIYLNN